MVSDSELGKREKEREHLALFLDAYEAATGESFPELYDSERRRGDSGPQNGGGLG